MINSGKIKSTFGAAVKELRKQKGITQEQLVEYLDIQSSTIAGIENGRAFVSSELISKLCNYFNVTPALFFFERVRILSEQDVDYINEIKRLLPSFSTTKLEEIYNILLALQK